MSIVCEFELNELDSNVVRQFAHAYDSKRHTKQLCILFIPNINNDMSTVSQGRPTFRPTRFHPKLFVQS